MRNYSFVFFDKIITDRNDLLMFLFEQRFSENPIPVLLNNEKELFLDEKSLHFFDNGIRVEYEFQNGDIYHIKC